MKLSQRSKFFIPLFSLFLLISICSVSVAQTKPKSGSEQRITQKQRPAEISTPIINSRSSKEAVQITLKDGSQRIVPAITGDIIWLVIITVLSGTLLAICLVVGLGAYRNPDFINKDTSNQFLSEALPTLIEGITIVYIVLALLLLSILGIASSEGTLSILAGITGYVLGKERSKNKPPDKTS
jgi:Na+-transporting methylmalonyl-CoA/oxaloacetate decarboxylase gamma subunit